MKKNLFIKSRSAARKSRGARSRFAGKKRPPLVSVVMPVHNAEKYAGEAIESVLAQTFRNFEFIIIDDASSDSSWNKVQKYAKRSKRIRAFRNRNKRGIAGVLRRAIGKARGDYITKIDCNDLCYKTRFDKQVKHLNAHGKTVAVGTQFTFINERGNRIGKGVFPRPVQAIYKYVSRFLPTQHVALMIAKKRLPIDFGFYSEGNNSLSETELVFKLQKYGRVEKLPYTLLKYRIADVSSLNEALIKTYILFFIARAKGAF